MEVDAGRKRRKEVAEKNKKKVKNNESISDLQLSSFDRTVFPLLLAAAAVPRGHNRGNVHARTVLRRFLRSHLDLLRRWTVPSTSASSPILLPSLLLPPSLLAVLPSLLTSCWPSVAVLSAEVVDAASLQSIEANKIVASDDGVVNALIRALGNRSRRVVEAACNTIMDLSTTSIGRQRLGQSSAVEKLLSLFCQVANVSPSCISHQIMEKETSGHSKSRAKKESFLGIILDTIMILINSSVHDCLDLIPEELVERFLPLLNELWCKIKDSTLTTDSQIILSGRTRYNLAETIFRLSMDQASSWTWEVDMVREGIFGSRETDFENFVLNYWESTPFLLNVATSNLKQYNTLFSSIICSFRSKTTDDVIDSILQGSLSCPPISSDELDINCFLCEVNGLLGSPLIYEQDIRILKAQPATSAHLNMKNEVHFFENGMESIYFDGSCLQKCKEAFRLGFTIALRGMELRFAKVTAIADSLADLFGLPSIGANLYLTPAKSQGLARHYDDHCVFVWQIFGQKQWKISPSPVSILPRLYEPLGTLAELENEACQGMKILLKEGDILYIPRGYSHEADTITDHGSLDIPSAYFSLHLTLAIEVEPPFEWEGFAHVALHSWQEKQKQASDVFCGSKSKKLIVISVLLLHILIRMIADQSPILRKACLVAAKFSSLEIIEEHQRRSLTTFHHIIDLINSSSGFVEAFKSVQSVVQEGNDQSLQWMRWLQHLPQAGAENEKLDFSNPIRVFAELIESCGECIDQVRMAFTETKLNFCRSVAYEDACKNFNVLLERYRRIRKQYMKGMLSLHSAY